MFISYIKLTNYSRVKLNNIQSIEIDFTDTTQLILGTNGCGKSSILSELTPYPPQSEFYSKNGGKVIHISHNNCSYILSTIFTKTAGEHSFIKNGAELNQGGTFTIQKNLVLEEFGLSQEVLNLLLGFDKFTKMDSNKRSNWFTKLSEVDYTYSLQIYNKVKEQYRDVVGALRTANKRLSIETSYEVNEKEEIKLKDTLDELYLKVSDLHKYKFQIDANQSTLESNIRLSNERLKELAIMYHKTILNSPTSLRNLSSNEINNYHDTLNNNLIQYKEKLSNSTSLYFDINNKLKQIDSVNSLLIDTSDKTIASYTEEKNLLSKSIVKEYISNIDNITVETFIQIFDVVSGIILNMPDNKNGYYSKEKYKESINKKEYLINNLNRFKNTLNQLELEYRHVQEDIQNNVIECPSCKHNWLLSGKVNRTLEDIIKDKNKLENDIIDINKQLEDIEIYINECTKYSSSFGEILVALSSNPELKKFMLKMIEEKLIQKSPNTVINLLSNIEKEIYIKYKLKDIDEKIKTILITNKFKNENNEVNVIELTNDRNKLEGEIEELTNRINITTEELKEIKKYINSLLQINKISLDINNTLKNLSSQIKDITKTYKNELIHIEIESTREDITSLSKRLDLIIRRNSIVKDIQEEIDSYKKKEESLKLIMKHLNPNDGLIADSLFGFIKTFINRMNSVLGKIWTYPIEILPCKSENAEDIILDYRFPMIINNQDDEIKDVSKGSEGIQEIINFAFRITALSFLKLVNYPLYLDEFGASFDPTHKPLAIKMVKELMEENAFPQLFFISHYSECHEVFSNAEVCLLCDKNIQLESSKMQLRVNHHVKIEKK